MIQNPNVIKTAYNRIRDLIVQTPVVSCDILNQIYNANIWFKVESLQHTGAFKVRGVLNHLMVLKESGKLPKQVVCYSTGNHGIGVSWASQLLDINARIYLPKNTAYLKQQIAKYYGAEVICTETRSDAEILSKYDGENEFYYLHPSDSDLTIAGVGTCVYEALDQIPLDIDYIFASCGGGGLLSGSYLAKELIAPQIKIIGVEPANANDAFLSLKSSKIYRFSDSPDTVADGLRTLGISARTFEYLKKLDDFMLVEEEDILYWSFWLTKLLKVAVEPSSALNMAAAISFIKNNRSHCQRPNILVLISGGNVDVELYKHFQNEQITNHFPGTL